MKYTNNIYSQLKIPNNEFGKIMRDISKSKESNLVTFKDSMKKPIHSWFYYKQGFSADLVPYILERYGRNNEEVIYDPFCGVGTIPLSSKELQISCIGIDISPLCVFVSRAKTNGEYDIKEICKNRNKLIKTKYHEPRIEYPDIEIVKKAIPERIKNKILFLKEEIEKIDEGNTRTFFRMALLSIMQDVVLAKRDGAFLRIDEARKVEDPIDCFRSKTYKMIQDLKHQQTTFHDFYIERSLSNKETWIDIREADAREVELDKESISKVITSPPYLNRYDYTRIYSPELGLYFIRDFDDLKRIRYSTLRSHVEAKYSYSTHVESNILNIGLEKIQEKLDNGEINNSKIPEMIRGYFEDTYIYLERANKFLMPGGIIAIAVGNARWSGVAIQTDLIICEISKQLGLDPIEINVCKIRGTSAQQAKKYGEEQVREGIIVLKKNN